MVCSGIELRITWVGEDQTSYYAATPAHNIYHLFDNVYIMTKSFNNICNQIKSEINITPDIVMFII